VPDERTPSADAVRRVAQQGHAPLDVGGRAHHGEGDALGARVEGELDLGLVDGRNAHERAAGGARGRGDHGVQRLAPDRRVLTIDEQEVGAGRGHRLSRDRRRDRAEDAVENAALRGEPLLEEHRA
jgi:hypothetical protein